MRWDINMGEDTAEQKISDLFDGFGTAAGEVDPAQAAGM